MQHQYINIIIYAWQAITIFETFANLVCHKYNYEREQLVKWRKVMKSQVPISMVKKGLLVPAKLSHGISTAYPIPIDL